MKKYVPCIINSMATLIAPAVLLVGYSANIINGRGFIQEIPMLIALVSISLLCFYVIWKSHIKIEDGNIVFYSGRNFYIPIRRVVPLKNIVSVGPHSNFKNARLPTGVIIRFIDTDSVVKEEVIHLSMFNSSDTREIKSIIQDNVAEESARSI